jgi:hypothetical protein
MLYPRRDWVMANPKGYKSGDDLGNVKESMDI